MGKRICPNCGKEVEEGSKFCGSCGAMMKESPGAGSGGEGPKGGSDAAKKSSDGGKKLPIVPIAAAVIAVIVVIVLIMTLGGGKTGKKKTININDYITVTFSGYDSVGTAAAEFDYAAFLEDYGDLSWDEDALSDYIKELYGEDLDEETIEEAISTVTGMYDPIDIVYEEFYYSYTLDKAEGLSNGDVVTLGFSVDEDEIEIMGNAVNCEFTYSDTEITVSDLEEIGTYDPFSDITVSFSGVSPEGEASVEVTGSGSIASSLSCTIDETKGLSNGDTVTVTVTTDAASFVGSDGVVLSPVEREYTVEGLSFYILSADDIPETDLERMKEEIGDSFTAYEAGWSDAVTLLGFDYIGSYLLTPKEGSGNLFYMLYQVNVEIYAETSDGFTDEVYTWYYYTCYKNLILTADGELQIDYLDFSTVSNKYNPYSGYEFYGYERLDDLYKTLVTANADSYTCENNVEDVENEFEATLIDDITLIPEDAVEYNGHYYKVYSVSGISWSEAKVHCEKRGGHLATITSEEEQDTLKLAVSSGGYFWIGGYYNFDGAWEWTTGEEMEYSGWASTPYRPEEFPYMSMHYDGWRKEIESGSTWWGGAVSGYICEWEPDEETESDEAEIMETDAASGAEEDAETDQEADTSAESGDSESAETDEEADASADSENDEEAAG